MWACYNVGIDLSECLGSQDMLQSLITDSLKPKVTKPTTKEAMEAAYGGACAPPPCVPCGTPLKVNRRKGKTGHCMFCCSTNNKFYGNLGVGDYGTVSYGDMHSNTNKNISSTSSLAHSSRRDLLIFARSPPH